jgi:hypothetical protein
MLFQNELGLLILRLEQRILLAALLWPKDAHLQGRIYDQQITHMFRTGPRAISAIKSSQQPEFFVLHRVLA